MPPLPSPFLNQHNTIEGVGITTEIEKEKTNHKLVCSASGIFLPPMIQIATLVVVDVTKPYLIHCDLEQYLFH